MKYIAEDRYAAPERLVLPTAPRNARGPDVDPDKIPHNPPFTAYIASLPFEVTEEDIERFFNDLRVSRTLCLFLLFQFNLPVCV